MKGKFLKFGTFAAAAALISLSACSDESSSAPAAEEDTPILPVEGSSASVDGTGTEIPGSNGTDTPLSSSSEEIDIADQPITEDDLKDDGTGAVTNLNVAISGVAEGPFANGATVSLSGVDVASMTLTGTPLATTVSSDLGNYKVSGNIGSAVASVEVNGSFLNFTQGEPAVATAGLKALSDLRERSELNVNILTRLEYDRVQYLVSTMGLSFTAAKNRAEKEVLAALGMPQDSVLFEDISFYDRTSAASKLLAASTVFLMDRTVADVEASIAAVAADIATDGSWDDMSMKAVLGDIAYSLDVGYSTSVLSEKNQNVDIEYFKVWVDRFWAEQYGLGSCGANNQNEIKANANTASTMAASLFVCQDSMWSVATERLLNHLQAEALFGACSDNNSGEMKTNAEGKYFVCKKSFWSIASDEDLVNLKISETQGACSADKSGKITQYESSYYICTSNMWVKTKNTPVDYSMGRAMNKLLGRGINFGNSWDSQGSDDCGWNNCIKDEWFKIAKEAGFNSIRLPVRWDSDASGSNVSSSRLAGVKADIDLALAQGMVVVVDFHHHGISSKYSASEKERFLGMWAQVAKELDKYGDKEVVLEILNEPHDIQLAQVNDLMTSAYDVIRKNAPGKTIMFEAGGYAKFAQIPNLKLPADGNIIVSGHYYEPYTFSHQGHGYDANDQALFSTTTIANDFKSYAESISLAFPDINGGGVPMNMGEFGVSSTNGGSSVSETSRAQWTDAVIAAAEKYGMSWHYWGFAGVGGFEAYDKNAGRWYPELMQVFSKYL